ncbi:MAG: spherulation-specific family 4 protein, partial [Dehalococcoidales bacterium]|nr:spherulation-specific family 4 protein [Dehalococcoidales bacterium]
MKSPSKITKKLLTLFTVLAMVFSIVLPLSSPAPIAAAAGDPPARLALVYYGPHEPEASTTIDDSLRDAQPEYLIVATESGYWHVNYPDTSFLSDTRISSFQGSYDINVIGYTTTAIQDPNYPNDPTKRIYEARPVQDVLDEIEGMAENDSVRGVFIDECTSFPDSTKKSYHQQLTDLADELGIIIWANVGVASFDPWYLTDGGYDFVNSVETWQDDEELTAVQQTWASRISVLGY